MDRLFSYFAAAKIVQTEGRTKEKPKDCKRIRDAALYTIIHPFTFAA